MCNVKLRAFEEKNGVIFKFELKCNINSAYFKSITNMVRNLEGVRGIITEKEGHAEIFSSRYGIIYMLTSMIMYIIFHRVLLIKLIIIDNRMGFNKMSRRYRISSLSLIYTG